MIPTPEELTDALLRQRLSQAVPPPPPTDGWEQLEARLTADPDVSLRESLAGLSPAVAPDWSALERKMDAAAATDAVVAEKLNALKPLPSAGAWAAFADKMDARNAEVVDVIVGDQLSRAGTGAVSGWSALAARLELIRDRRQRIFAGAVIELSLMLSLLLLLVRFGPTQADQPAPRPLAGVFPLATAEIVAINEENSASPLQMSDAIGDDLPTKVTIEHVGAATESQQADPVVADVVMVLETMQTGQMEPVDVDYTGEPASLSDGETPMTAEVAGASELIGDEEVSEELVVESLLGEKMPQPALRLAPLVEGKVPTMLYAHVFVSPVDVNQVITRTLPVNNFDVTGDNRLTQGTSAGVLLDMMHGKFGVQFGAIYSQVSYIPSALKYYLDEEYPLVEAPRGYSRFEFRKLTLPFSINQVITENENWRWTAQATMAVSIAATTSFNISDEDRDYIEVFNREVEDGRLPTAPAGASGRSTGNQLWFKLIDPPPGAFEGGSIFDNANFYVGGGLMVERLLGTRSSVYISPSFGRVLYFNPEKEDAGTGPYQDKIHMGQLRFGARYRLGSGQR